jgi:hypothetical protein
MTHGQPHEEAEHASHHAQDPFDRRVAMSMVVIAAVLAGVKVLGHRAHNDTLAYLSMANTAHTKSSSAHTQESDQWNFFQAKKMREVLADLRAYQAVPQVTSGKTDEQLLKQIEADLQETTDNLEKPPKPKGLPPVKEQAKTALANAKKERDRLKKNYPEVKPEQLERCYEAKVQAARYRAESRIILNEAARKHKEAEEYEEEAHKYHEKSEDKHHQAFYFDLGELGVELALVLSSVAILTKRLGFWYGGIAVGAVGLLVVVLGFILVH